MTLPVLRHVPLQAYHHQQWVKHWKQLGHGASLCPPSQGQAYLALKGESSKGRWQALLAVDSWLSHHWPGLGQWLDPADRLKAAREMLLAQPAALGPLPPGLGHRPVQPVIATQAASVPSKPLACWPLSDSHLWFTSLPALIHPVAAQAVPEGIRQLPLPLRASLGRSRVPMSQWLRLGPGGVALIERWQPGIYLAEHCISTLDFCEEHSMTQLTDTLPETAREASVLEHGMVAVDFVVHRARLSLAELAALGPGQIITLPEAALLNVELVVEGRTLAKGELVRLGDKLGVQVQTMAGACADE